MGTETGDESRQIVAVVRADMVGSTNLLSEQGVDVAIDTRHRANAAIAEACGDATMLDSRGDGVVVGFRSAIEALRAGWQLQDGLRGDTDVHLRVSVTIEEIAPSAMLDVATQERTQSYESQCPPGCVVVDDRVWRAVRGHSGPAFEPLHDDLHQLVAFSTHGSNPSVSTSLACTLFSDLVAEAGVPRSTASAASEISARCIRAAGGVIADSNGAGHMAIFDSASAAIIAAHALHNEAISYGLRSDVTETLAFGVGMSMGEITTTADASFGIAVVEAARLLELARASTTYLGSDVREVPADTFANSEELGAVALKGLADPVHIVGYEYGSAVPSQLELPAAFQRDQRFLMVGRGHELAAIRHQWETTLAGTGTAMLLTGEEGVGKTRLVRDFARSVHQQGAIVLYGGCDEDLAVPYAPIAAALRKAATLDPLIESAIRSGEGALGVLLGSDAPSGSETGLSSDVELFDAVADALARLSTLRPVLLVIDDVQWSDRDTSRLVDHCLKALSSSRVQVLATCRTEAVDTVPAVQDFLGGSGSERRVHRLGLERLTGAHIVAMLESRKSTLLVGPELDLAEKITATTGGNPLYVEELMVYLVDSQLLVNEPELGWSLAIDLADLAIPESLTDVVVRRLAQLPGDDRDTLRTAAVIGASFDSEVLAEVADIEISTAMDVLDRAQVARLVEFTGAGDTYRFTDEICRTALMRDVLPARRSLTHLAIAEALERLAPNRIDELIVHWSAAVGRAARTKAVHYLRIATDRDMAAAAWESVVVRQRKVLELLDVDGVEDLDLLAATHLALGAALRLLGDDAYQPEVMKAADIARKASNPQQLFQAATAMMRPGSWVPEAGVVDVAIVAMCEDALLLLGDDDPIRPRVLAVMATALAWDPDPLHRASLVAEAQALAKGSKDRQLIGTTLMAELVSERRPELFERRRHVADEVRVIGRATSNSDLLFTGTWYVILDLLERGEIARATELLAELKVLAESRRDYFSGYLMSYVEAALAIARCEPGAAELVEANRELFESESVDSFAVWVLQSGVLAMYAGSLAELLQPIAAAVDMWHEEWGRKWDYALAKTYLDIGDHDAALTTIRSNPEPEADAYWLSSYCPLAQIGLTLDLPDVCESVIERLTPFRGRIAMVGSGIAFVGQASTALGQAHLGLGNLDQAEALFRESVTQAESVGFPYLVSNAKRFLAETLLTKDPADEEGLGLLQQVLALADQHGFELERSEANRLLAQI